MAEIDGLAQPMAEIDGLAQPMGKLDGLASNKEAQAQATVACALLRGRVSGRVWRPAGGLGGRRPPQNFFNP